MKKEKTKERALIFLKKNINLLPREKNIGWKETLLAVQHLVSAFGATTLVPLLTGFSVPVALFTAGLGTLLFHLLTKQKVPIFLGSSFAFIPVIIIVAQTTGNLQYAQGGIVVAGLLYVLFSYIVYKVGVENIAKIFVPHIIGTMIFIVGITLIPVAIDMAAANWLIAGIVFTTAIFMQIFLKGFLKQMSIIVAIALGYVISIFTVGIDASGIVAANWIAVPTFTLPKFDVPSILVIAPVVLAVLMEHIGDITANQTITGQNYLKDPGLHRTLLGDGIATMAAGLLGGPANTTYSENTGVLALTGNYNPAILRLAAVFAIVISFIGKLSAVFATIPVFVLGGISLVLFGMIAMIGIKTLYKDQVWYSAEKLICITLMLVVGLNAQLNITDTISLSSMSLAAIVGIGFNILVAKARKIVQHNIKEVDECKK